MVDPHASYSLKLFSPCNGREAGDWCEHSLRVKKNIKRLLDTQEKGDDDDNVEVSYLPRRYRCEGRTDRSTNRGESYTQVIRLAELVMG